MANILLACIEPLFSAGASSALKDQAHEVPTCVFNGAAAIAALRSTAPDLLVLDFMLPDTNGTEVLQWLRQSGRNLPVLVLGNDYQPHFIDLARQYGAAGYLSRSEPPEQLLLAVRTLLSGRTFFPRHAFEDVSRRPGDRQESRLLATLSPRELTVMKQLAQGNPIKSIAATMKLSPSAVSTYKTRLFQKLDLHSNADLLAFAWRHGVAPAAGLGKMHFASGQGPRLQEFIEMLPFPTALRARDGALLLCNQSFADLHGLSRQACLGMEIAPNGIAREQLTEQVRRGYLKAVADARSFVSDFVAHFPQGPRTVRVWGVPHRDESGQVLGMLCAIVDVSDFDSEVAQLTQAQQRMLSLRQLRTHFFIAECKRFEEQLSILEEQLADLAKSTPEAASLRNPVGMLKRHTELLLELAELDQGSRVPLPETCDLNALTNQAVETFARRYAASVTLSLPQTATCAWMDAGLYGELLATALAFVSAESSANLHVEARQEYRGHGESVWRIDVNTPDAGLPFDRFDAHLGLARRLAPLIRASLTFSGLPLRLPCVIELQLLSGPEPPPSPPA